MHLYLLYPEKRAQLPWKHHSCLLNVQINQQIALFDAVVILNFSGQAGKFFKIIHRSYICVCALDVCVCVCLCMEIFTIVQCAHSDLSVSSTLPDESKRLWFWLVALGSLWAEALS